MKTIEMKRAYCPTQLQAMGDWDTAIITIGKYALKNIILTKNGKVFKNLFEYELKDI